MDYRLYAIDINLEIYFREKFSRQDKINKRVLDSNKYTCREKYKEYTEEILDITLIETLIDQLCISFSIKEVLESTDNYILYLINKERKRIEVQNKNILHSREKV